MGLLALLITLVPRDHHEANRLQSHLKRVVAYIQHTYRYPGHSPNCFKHPLTLPVNCTWKSLKQWIARTMTFLSMYLALKSPRMEMWWSTKPSPLTLGVLLNYKNCYFDANIFFCVGKSNGEVGAALDTCTYSLSSRNNAVTRCCLRANLSFCYN